MRRGANATIVNVPNTGGATLRENHGGEIDLVMRWPYAWPKLRDDIRGVAAEIPNHPVDRGSSDAEFRPLPAGVKKRDHAPLRIGKVDGAAVGDMDAKTDAAIRRDQTIGAEHRRLGICIDDRNLASVDLLRRNEDPIQKAELPTSLSVKCLQACHRRFTIDRDVEARNAPHKTVPDRRHRFQGGKGVERNAGHAVTGQLFFCGFAAAFSAGAFPNALRSFF